MLPVHFYIKIIVTISSNIEKNSSNLLEKSTGTGKSICKKSTKNCNIYTMISECRVDYRLENIAEN